MASKKIMVGLVVAIVIVLTIFISQNLSSNDIKGNFSIGEQGRGVNVDSNPEAETDQRFQIFEENQGE